MAKRFPNFVISLLDVVDFTDLIRIETLPNAIYARYTSDISHEQSSAVPLRFLLPFNGVTSRRIVPHDRGAFR